VGQAFLAAYGWSLALVLLSVITALMIPLAAPLSGRAETVPGQQSLAEGLAEAARHSGYWYLLGGFFVCGFQLAFIGTHLPAYVGDYGISGAIAAWALALVGLFNVAGSYVSGVLGGRYSKKYLLSFLY